MMAWELIIEGSKAIWKCSRYDDLQYNEINNLAQYGQPHSPYQ